MDALSAALALCLNMRGIVRASCWRDRPFAADDNVMPFVCVRDKAEKVEFHSRVRKWVNIVRCMSGRGLGLFLYDIRLILIKQQQRMG
jgi:hypothetical protein